MPKPDIATAVRDDIVRGLLQADTPLKMQDLKQRFDVGFSPIREALARLSAEGLVTLSPNRGFWVPPLSGEDLADIAIARTAVEQMGVRLSIEHGDDRWESEIVAAMHRYRRRANFEFCDETSIRAWEEAHDDLHRALIAACGSPRLKVMQTQLQRQHQRYRRHIVLPGVAPSAHIEEHERLVAIVLERDVESAFALIGRHLQITVEAHSSIKTT